MNNIETVKLNDGIEMPMLGFVTYQITPNTTLDNVAKALRLGYRMIDTAQYYGNEEGVGEAIKESGLNREKLFVTTKVQTSGYEETKKGLDDSLLDFNQDYFDLVLLHWPMGNDLETYRALEDAYKDGKVRAIGLSNFNKPQVQEIIDNSSVKPVVNQIETHILWQQQRMHEYLTANDIVHESYSLLGEAQPGFLNNIPVIEEMAKLRDLDAKKSIDGWPSSMQENNY